MTVYNLRNEPRTQMLGNPTKSSVPSELPRRCDAPQQTNNIMNASYGSLRTFLATARNTLQSALRNKSRITFVIGNESAG